MSVSLDTCVIATLSHVHVTHPFAPLDGAPEGREEAGDPEDSRDDAAVADVVGVEARQRSEGVEGRPTGRARLGADSHFSPFNGPRAFWRTASERRRPEPSTARQRPSSARTGRGRGASLARRGARGVRRTRPSAPRGQGRTRGRRPEGRRLFLHQAGIRRRPLPRGRLRRLARSASPASRPCGSARRQARVPRGSRTPDPSVSAPA